jgi:hypothetical protein
VCTYASALFLCAHVLLVSENTSLLGFSVNRFGGGAELLRLALFPCKGRYDQGGTPCLLRTSSGGAR